MEASHNIEKLFHVLVYGPSGNHLNS